MGRALYFFFLDFFHILPNCSEDRVSLSYSCCCSALDEVELFFFLLIIEVVSASVADSLVVLGFRSNFYDRCKFDATWLSTTMSWVASALAYELASI